MARKYTKKVKRQVSIGKGKVTVREAGETILAPVEEKAVVPTGPLGVYRPERWSRLDKKGYAWIPELNRGRYCGKIAEPEPEDPEHERNIQQTKKG